MDVREKLVELLEPHTSGLACEYESGSCELTSCRSCNTKNIADHLIANGVTVQEWISVKDRLPEDDSDVIAYLRTGEEGRIFPANYAKGVWFDCIFNKRVTETTTHWMPLPQPPKGE